uniref:Reverse transcriptase domain-containing protein n=1 Tax=Heligmosomoides polygyrus TaxID=6339 RepID=A0A183GCH2_HELPZ
MSRVLLHPGLWRLRSGRQSTVFVIMHEEGSRAQQQPQDAIFEETIQKTTDAAFRLDPRDLQKSTVVTDIVHDLNVRNDTLKIADEHPEVFQYLETKSKADSLQSTDPKLSEFVDSIKKRDEEQTKKRMIAATFQPFVRGKQPGHLLPHTSSQQDMDHNQWPEAFIARSHLLTQVGAVPRMQADTFNGMTADPGRQIELSSRNRIVARVNARNVEQKGTGGESARTENSHVDYLGFCWINTFYQVTVLPFGLASAPHIFTKILRTFVERWRSLSLGVALYLDDGIIFKPSRESCFNTTSVVRLDLERFGASQKGNASSHLAKSQTNVRRTFLNLCYVVQDLLYKRDLDGQISVKLERLQEKLQPRNRRRCLSAQGGENLTTKLTDKNLTLPSAVPCFKYLLYVDASSHSVGAILKDAGELTIASSFRELPITLRNKSSTARELFAMKFGLEAFSKELSGPTRWLTESQAFHPFFEKGSLSVKLHKLGEDIWDIESKQKLRLNVKWIPRGLNQEADEASRLIDYDDWRINNRTFESLAYGDIQKQIYSRMIANDRTKCVTFCSSQHCPGTSGIDAFTVQEAWNSGLLWLVPPVSLIARVLRWCSFFKSVAILGCPLWTSQSYFPILKDNGRNWAYFVKDGILFPIGSKIFDESGQPGAFGSQFSKSPFVFLLVDFRNKPLLRKLLHF